MSEETPKVQPEKPAFDERKKNALLRYVAILFAAAFVLVLFSMLSQMRDNRATISQLNQSSTSALRNAEQLQDNNRLLEENNEYLKEEVAELTDRIAELEQALAAAETATEDQQSAETAEQEKLRTEKEQQLQAYEALLQLQANPTEEAKAKFEIYKSYLGPQGLETYESILMEEGE